MRWNEASTYGPAAGLGYLLGSVPAALLVARRHGVDLRAVGDRNPGAWNALEQLGPRRAWPAFVGDGIKGTAAGLAGRALAGLPGGYAGVAGAMLGHAFPLWDPARGGKSVMTFAGGAFAVSPPAAFASLGACLLVTRRAGSFRLGARVGVFGFPLVQLAFEGPERVRATGGLMAIIGVRFVSGWLGAGRRGVTR